MEEQYGSDFLSIVDDDGNEYDLEVLHTLEYQGCQYLAVLPAGRSAEEFSPEITILRSVEEGDESYLYPIEDETELQAVYDLIMDAVFEGEDTEDEE